MEWNGLHCIGWTFSPALPVYPSTFKILIYWAPTPTPPQAVAADTDYYGQAPSLFSELLKVLSSLGLAPPADVADLRRLLARVQEVRACGERGPSGERGAVQSSAAGA